MHVLQRHFTIYDSAISYVTYDNGENLLLKLLDMQRKVEHAEMQNEVVHTHKMH